MLNSLSFMFSLDPNLAANYFHKIEHYIITLGIFVLGLRTRMRACVYVCATFAQTVSYYAYPLFFFFEREREKDTRM